METEALTPAFTRFERSKILLSAYQELKLQSLSPNSGPLRAALSPDWGTTNLSIKNTNSSTTEHPTRRKHTRHGCAGHLHHRRRRWRRRSHAGEQDAKALDHSEQHAAEGSRPGRRAHACAEAQKAARQSAGGNRVPRVLLFVHTTTPFSSTAAVTQRPEASLSSLKGICRWAEQLYLPGLLQ